MQRECLPRVLPLPEQHCAASQLPLLDHVPGVVAIVLGFLQGITGADQLTAVVVLISHEGEQGAPALGAAAGIVSGQGVAGFTTVIILLIVHRAEPAMCMAQQQGASCAVVDAPKVCGVPGNAQTIAVGIADA